MAFFFSSSPHHQLCKSSFPLSHFNFHSLSPPKHSLQPVLSPLLVKAQVSHIETKTPTTNSTNHKTNGKSPSGLFLARDENKRVVKTIGENGTRKKKGVSHRSSKGEIFVKKMNDEVSHIETKVSTFNSTNHKSNGKSPSGLCLSTDENKRVTETIGENDSRKKRAVGLRVSYRTSKGEIFVEKNNNGVSHIEAEVSSSNSINHKTNRKSVSGLCISRDENKGGENKFGEYGSRKRREIGSKGGIFVKKMNNEVGKKPKKGVDKEKMGKNEKKSIIESPGLMMRVGLDMCSKKGDVMGALKIYDKAQTEGLKLGQYHYSVLLYLCSSAAIGVVSPAKSGNSSRSLSSGEVSTLNSMDANENFEVCDGDFGNMDRNNQISNNGKTTGNGEVVNGEIRLNDDFRKYALKKGFEIYERMRLEKVPMNEASLTSIARMALAMGDGDMAFDTVKQMKELGINPRLRSYGPALTAFCNSGNIDKAFLVEEHMLEHGVFPEEPELEALLRVSIEGNRSDKVYYLLQKLRTSVRQVSASTADLIEKWFRSEAASEVGKIKWDERKIKRAVEKGGGGWHGEGWLGKGKWNILRTTVGEDGFCKCCGGKLATIDLDPVETEKFAESVASIATKRERSSFQKFQKWLDYYGPFEAIVDAANIGLFTQRKFQPSKVNAVVNGIRHMLPSKKWPLIVLHNRRVTDDNMDKPMNKAIVEKWKKADALYATPTGSNDDWYWLYAAIKFKCLLVTNDEMRDHLFQLLGNDFFPRWKERHQVHFSFSETGPVFHMPPPCSVVIQESEKGHWHIPLASEHEVTEERKWLCVTRDTLNEKTKYGGSDTGNNRETKRLPQKNSSCGNKSTSIASSKYSTILQDIEAAEKLGVCVIDFQI